MYISFVLHLTEQMVVRRDGERERLRRQHRIFRHVQLRHQLEQGKGDSDHIWNITVQKAEQYRGIQHSTVFLVPVPLILDIAF